jgi:hypothetical protein
VTLWEFFGAALLFGVIVGGVALAAFYERDLFLNLVGRDRQ